MIERNLGNATDKQIKADQSLAKADYITLSRFPYSRNIVPLYARNFADMKKYWILIALKNFSSESPKT